MTMMPRGRKKPRIFYGWYIVMAHMSLHFYISMVWVYGIGAFFNPIVAELGWTRTQFSLAASLNRLEGSVATPVEGYLVDRFGPRKLVLVGVPLVVIALILLSRVHSLITFYGAYLLVALGTSACLGIPFTVAVARWFRQRRGWAMGWLFSGATFSGLFLPLVILGNDELGWRTTMLLCGLGFLPLGLIAIAVVRDRPEPYGYLPDGVDPGEETAAPENPSRGAPAPAASGATAIEALRTPAFWALTLIFGIASMGPSGMFLHQIAYFRSIGFTAAAAASTVGTFTLLSGIGRIGAGWVMDRMDYRWVLAGLVGLNVAGFLVLLNVTQYWHSVVYSLLFGVSFGGGIPARPIIVSGLFGTRAFGTIQGLIQSLTVVGGVVAPILMAWVYDTTGSYRAAILLLTALIGAALPLTLLLPKMAPRRTRA